jgi:hypothetical protein
VTILEALALWRKFKPIWEKLEPLLEKLGLLAFLRKLVANPAPHPGRDDKDRPNKPDDITNQPTNV